MALPVIKQKQKETISSNLKDQDPGEQFITAARLRGALNPIVDATNNMKTIWSGTVRVRTQWYKGDYPDNVQCDSRYNAIWVQEDYYDNEYFPALDRGNLDRPLEEYTLEGCRYRIINQGSGLPNGFHYNIGTDSLINNQGASQNYNANVYGGFGLTLNCKVDNGSLTAVQVVNPGSGYCWGRQGSNVTDGQNFHPQDIAINLPGNVKPIIRYDLSRVVNQAFISGYSQTPCTRDGNDYVTNVWSYLNFFVPKADSHYIYGNEIKVIDANTLIYSIFDYGYNGKWAWRDNSGNDMYWTPTTRFSGAKLEFNWGRAMRYPTGGFQDTNPPVKGFSVAINATPATFSANSSKTVDRSFSFTLQVPIKNQTTDIPGGNWD